MPARYGPNSTFNASANPSGKLCTRLIGQPILIKVWRRAQQKFHPAFAHPYGSL